MVKALLRLLNGILCYLLYYGYRITRFASWLVKLVSAQLRNLGNLISVDVNLRGAFSETRARYMMISTLCKVFNPWNVFTMFVYKSMDYYTFILSLCYYYFIIKLLSFYYSFARQFRYCTTCNFSSAKWYLLRFPKTQHGAIYDCLFIDHINTTVYKIAS